MSRQIVRALCVLAVSGQLSAQDLSKYTPEALDKELASASVARLAVKVPMRDGVTLTTDIYLPNGGKSPYPVILWRTPYNEHRLHGLTLRYAIGAVRRGYAFILQNERGRYFSGGTYEILGRPQTDGYDTLSWIAKQDWSTGKVGTLGCSSSAEWQLALAAQRHPAHAAMVPMSAGAGIGKVGRFSEQGNWYTGGVPRSLFFVWLYHVDNPLRAQLPDIADEALRARVEGYNALDPVKPVVDWPKQARHLPVDTMLSSLGEPPATFEKFIARTPADPAWRQGGLYQDGMGWGVPALWFNAWYDVSIGPNLELFDHVRAAGDRGAAEQQYAVIAPTTHCAYDSLSEHTIAGDREMGDARFDVDGAVFGWFDRWLKGDTRAFPNTTPHVRYYTMGANAWRKSDQWPPSNTRTERFYLHSGGRANSLDGDGILDQRVPGAKETADRFRSDPMNPVPTIGGGDCCNGGLVVPGAVDQRPVEARHDVLVYTSAPLTRPLEVSGFVDAVLHVGSSAKDTDFAVKLVDVDTDGTAWIIGDTILRARYRDGYERPTEMVPGQTYTLRPSPIATSNRFQIGHRIRIEIASTNFPKFVRNLNVGGANEHATAAVVAENSIYHRSDQQSYIELPVTQ